MIEVPLYLGATRSESWAIFAGAAIPLSSELKCCLKTIAGLTRGPCPPRPRCRASMAHIRQSRPDSGLGFQANVLKPFKGVPSSLGSGWGLSSSSLIPSLLDSHVNLEWCDKIKLSNLLLPRKSGTIKSLQLRFGVILGSDEVREFCEFRGGCCGRLVVHDDCLKEGIFRG